MSLTRRHFMAMAASLPVVATAFAAIADDTVITKLDRDKWYLVYDWSSDKIGPVLIGKFSGVTEYRLTGNTFLTEMPRCSTDLSSQPWAQPLCTGRLGETWDEGQSN